MNKKIVLTLVIALICMQTAENKALADTNIPKAYSTNMLADTDLKLDYMGQQILSNLTNENESFIINVNTLSPSMIQNKLDTIKKEYPLEVYNIKDYSVDCSNPSYITINCKYNMTKSQSIEFNTESEKIVSSLITDDMTIVDKEKVIHDWICSNIEYDYAYKIYDPYNTLIQRKGVCEGYALLAQKMYSLAGIKSQVIVGVANNGHEIGGHAWNLVYVGNSWKHVDCAWDSIKDKHGNLMARHDYFNLKDTEISKNHNWVRDSYPKAE